MVNGEKTFITYAESFDTVLVLARMQHPERQPRLSTFIVEKGTPGFSVGRQIRKMGTRWEDTAPCPLPTAAFPPSIISMAT